MMPTRKYNNQNWLPSIFNDFFDNVILDSTDWSMESLSQKYNNTINNLSQIPSRGISLSVGGGSVIILPGMSD